MNNLRSNIFHPEKHHDLARPDSMSMARSPTPSATATARLQRRLCRGRPAPALGRGLLRQPAQRCRRPRAHPPHAEQHDAATFQRPDFEALLDRGTIKTRNYQRLLSAGAIPLRADIGQLICDARTEGLRLAIASSSTPQNVASLLRANLGPKADTGSR